MSERVEEIIRKYRKKRISGICIDLVPFSEADAANVVQVRNREKNRYFLHQTCMIDIENQLNWYASYLKRDNDIYWCIYNKKGQFIGTIRIYDIDREKDLCNQGSFMIGEEFSGEAPYAVEAEILSLDFVFEVLKIQNVINEDRVDNKVMNNLSKKAGFVFKKDITIRGVDYNYYLLNQKAYEKSRERFARVVEHWAKRE